MNRRHVLRGLAGAVPAIAPLLAGATHKPGHHCTPSDNHACPPGWHCDRHTCVPDNPAPILGRCRRSPELAVVCCKNAVRAALRGTCRKPYYVPGKCARQFAAGFAFCEEAFEEDGQTLSAKGGNWCPKC